MKTFFKRSAVSVIVIGMASSALAATPAKSNDSFSPQFTGVFLGVEGLYLRPQSGDLDYVSVYPATANDAFQNHSIDPNYSWDWRVYGGIKFTDNDDITLSWMSMRNSESENLVGNGAFLLPRWMNEQYADTWNDVNSKVTFDLDDAYAVWGHTVNFNNPWSVRYGFGIEYAKLDSDLTVSSQPSPGFGYIGWTSESQFKGIGPRAEVDMTYHLPYGFSLYGKANAALLVSNREVDLSPINVLDPAGVPTEFQGVNYSDRHVVVPKVGMRLGASYDYTFGQVGGEGPCRTTTLTLDAGWQVESYIHAIERFDGNGIDYADISAVAPAYGYYNTSTKTSNFADQGFYIGLKVSSDWM